MKKKICWLSSWIIVIRIFRGKLNEGIGRDSNIQIGWNLLNIFFNSLFLMLLHVKPKHSLCQNLIALQGKRSVDSDQSFHFRRVLENRDQSDAETSKELVLNDSFVLIGVENLSMGHASIEDREVKSGALVHKFFLRERFPIFSNETEFKCLVPVRIVAINS